MPLEYRTGPCLCGKVGGEEIKTDPKTGEHYIERCPRWIKLRGSHPQTGEPLDEWNCVDVWKVILAIEGSQQTRQAGAAVESLRNEIVKRADKARLERANDLLSLRHGNQKREG